MSSRDHSAHLDALLEFIQSTTAPTDDHIVDKDSLPEETLKQTWDDKLKEEELFDRQQNRSQRKEYADNIFSFLCVYMLFIGIIIAGVGNRHCKFYLSDTVLITLITTTTANVIGVFIFVVKYLFNPKQ